MWGKKKAVGSTSESICGMFLACMSQVPKHGFGVRSLVPGDGDGDAHGRGVLFDDHGDSGAAHDMW